eukprot:6199846-Pleurochrysis_carterae.AAC.2
MSAHTYVCTSDYACKALPSPMLANSRYKRTLMVGVYASQVFRAQQVKIDPFLRQQQHLVHCEVRLCSSLPLTRSGKQSFS